MALLLIGALAMSAVHAADSLAWPRFRGPNGSGVADDQKPPVEFGPEKNVKWRVPVPGGMSSPIAAGDLLVITAFEDGKLYTIAFNRADGTTAWKALAPATQLEVFHRSEGSPAASTPTTDGQRIVSYFGSCGLFCYDLSGRELWKIEMPPAATAGDFGSGTSPILAEGCVILVRDETRDPKMLVIDSASGTVKWEAKRQSATSYCTPVIWDGPEGKQIVSAGHGRLIAYELATGKEKWHVVGMPSACCTSPVVDRETILFAGWSPGGQGDTESKMPTFDDLLKDLDANTDGSLGREEAEKAFGSFFNSQDANKDGQLTRDEWDAIMRFMSDGKNSAFAVKAGASGDATASHVLWRKTKGAPYVSTAIAYRGQYVMIKDGGIITAYDTTSGREVYQERAAAQGKYYASPVAANGNIYFTALDDGTITVIRAGKDTPEVVATNAKLGERTAATPAIVDNTLFVRTAGHLFAFAAAE